MQRFSGTQDTTVPGWGHVEGFSSDEVHEVPASRRWAEKVSDVPAGPAPGQVLQDRPGSAAAGAVLTPPAGAGAGGDWRAGLNREDGDPHWVHDKDAFGGEGSWVNIGECHHFHRTGKCAYEHCKFIHGGSVADRLRALHARQRDTRSQGVVHWVGCTVVRFDVPTATWKITLRGQPDRHYGSLGWLKTRGRSVPHPIPIAVRDKERQVALELIGREHGVWARNGLRDHGRFLGMHFEEYRFGVNLDTRGSCSVYAFAEVPNAGAKEKDYHMGVDMHWFKLDDFHEHPKRGRTAEWISEQILPLHDIVDV